MVKVGSINIESSALVNNLLKDPTTREIITFTPDEPKPNAPLFICLPGFGFSARSYLNVNPIGESFMSVVQGLYDHNRVGGATIAIVDSMTKLGGNQYINSTAAGNYEDFIIGEVIPQLKERFNSGNVGLFGKGSGGFGAYTLAVRNPSAIQGFAAHSPDAGFEYCYIPDFNVAMEEFKQTGGPAKWVQKFWNSKNKARSVYMRTLGIIAFAAFYSPNESSNELGTDFPFDWDTGEFRQDVWSRWQSWDPARNARDFVRQIESMQFIYHDIGVMDEFSLLWGNRFLDNIITNSGIKHFYEEYEDGHFGTTYRFEKSLSMMATALSI
jgi:S-formylglutathione hydrolase FrmB